jgi:hypothetical protein
MSGDNFHICGPISGSNIGGSENVVYNAGTRVAARARVDDLIADALLQAQELPESPERALLLQELNGVGQDLDTDVDEASVSTRLERLTVWAQALGLALTATDIVTAVKGWFAAGS